MYILEFKTARNTCGYRKYLAFDTDRKVFTRNDPRMITEGIEIKARDYNKLVESFKKHGFIEVECL